MNAESVRESKSTMRTRSFAESGNPVLEPLGEATTVGDALRVDGVSGSSDCSVTGGLNPVSRSEGREVAIISLSAQAKSAAGIWLR